MNNDDFKTSLEFYINSLRSKMRINKMSDNTIMAYGSTYKYFLKFVSEYKKQLTFKNIRENDIYAFIEYKSNHLKKGREISASTTNSIVVHLKKLFKHIERNSEELYDFDSVFNDIKLKTPKRVPKGLTEDEVLLLEGYMEKLKQNEKFTNFRNVFLIKLLLYGCMRASESLVIRLDDITHIPKKGLYRFDFIGKGDKNRFTYIPENLISDEVEMLENGFKIPLDTPVAITSKGKQMSRFELGNMINRIYKKLGIEASGIHILRHTAAKRLLKKAGLPIIQQLLGHSSIQTTSIYSNPTTKMIEDAMQ